MSNDAVYDHDDKSDIERILIGHKVTKVDKDTLTLDDGTLLTLIGNAGGCSCGSGDYDLVELDGIDNVITKVEFEDSPSGDDYIDGSGYYRIFVFADNRRVNLATFEGSDGNGYYGTGYSIRVRPGKPTQLGD